jgi:hypothetical protein
VSALSDLLNAHLPKGKTVRQIALAIDQDDRYDVKLSTIYPYFNGKHGQPELKTLHALAQHVPGVSLRQLLEAAGLPNSAGPYEPPAEAELLNARQRRALDDLIRSMVEPRADAKVTRLSAVRDTPKAPPRGEAASKKRGGGRDGGQGEHG